MGLAHGSPVQLLIQRSVELKDVTLVEQLQERDNELGGDGLVLPPVQRLAGGLDALFKGDVGVEPGDIYGDKDTVGREILDVLNMTLKVTRVSEIGRVVF